MSPSNRRKGTIDAGGTDVAVEEATIVHPTRLRKTMALALAPDPQRAGIFVCARPLRLAGTPTTGGLVTYGKKLEAWVADRVQCSVASSAHS